jgi:hypothetical protein
MHMHLFGDSQNYPGENQPGSVFANLHWTPQPIDPIDPTMNWRSEAARATGTGRFSNPPCSGKMNTMRIPSLLAVVIFALPLLAQPARRVAAPCQLASASLSLSGEESPERGRGYVFQVTNHSPRPLAMPSSPDFGWRVDTWRKSDWKLKAEGGPVRLLTSSGTSDPHMAVTGPSGSGPLFQIAPSVAHDFSFFLPEAEAALRPDPDPKVPVTTLKLTVFWAAPAALVQSDHSVPPCALSAEWVVKMEAP